MKRPGNKLPDLNKRTEALCEYTMASSSSSGDLGNERIKGQTVGTAKGKRKIRATERGRRGIKNAGFGQMRRRNSSQS